VKWVSELNPCFLVAVGHYICVKPTQVILKKKTLQFFFKKNLYKKGGPKYKKPRLQKKYTRTRVYMEIQVVFMLM